MRKLLYVIILFLSLVLINSWKSYAQSFQDDVSAPLADRISAREKYTDELKSKRNTTKQNYVNYTGLHKQLDKEFLRMNELLIRSTVAISLDLTRQSIGSIANSPKELISNIANELVEIDKLLYNYNPQNFTEAFNTRLAIYKQLSKALDKNLISQKNSLNELNTIDKELQTHKVEIERLKKLYFNATGEQYKPSTNTNRLFLQKQEEINQIINNVESSISNSPSTGYPSAIEAASVLRKAFSVRDQFSAYYYPLEEKEEYWSSPIKVWENANGIERWLFQYKLLPFTSESEVSEMPFREKGGVINLFIETQSYNENNQTRYKSAFCKPNYLVYPNIPVELTSMSGTGILARGHSVFLTAEFEDLENKLDDVYWYARGKNGEEVKDILIGIGKDIAWNIPVDIYEFDSIIGISIMAADINGGVGNTFVTTSIHSGVNDTYQGISLYQEEKAIPGKTFFIKASPTTPEYGETFLNVTYNNKNVIVPVALKDASTLCISLGAPNSITAASGEALIELEAKKDVTSVKVSLETYAGGTLIAKVSEVNFEISFDAVYLNSQQSNSLQSSIDGINLQTEEIKKDIAKLRRVGYSNLTKSLSMSSSYAKEIIDVIENFSKKGISYPNMPYTVEYATQSSNEMLEYLDSLQNETGLGDQTLISALRKMQIEGTFDENLAFIDIFYLKLKAAQLNLPAVKTLLKLRNDTILRLNTLNNSIDKVKSDFESGTGNLEINALSKINDAYTQIDNLTNLLSDGAYEEHIMNEVFSDIDNSINYLQKEYPNFNTLVNNIKNKGTTRSGLRLVINGNKAVSTESPIQIINGRTMAPLRLIAETLKCKVDWRDEDRTVIITSSQNQEMSIPPQQEDIIKIFVNGIKINPDVPPIIINGRTMVPVRFIAEALGARVDWDENSSTAFIELDVK